MPDDRRPQHGVVEIALGVVERSLGLGVGRKLFDRQVEVAEQLGLGVRHLLLDEGVFGPRRDQRRRWRCRDRAASRSCSWPAADLRSTSFCFRSIVCCIRSAICSIDLDVGDQIVVGGARLLQRRLGLVHRELVGHRVDLEQLVALVDLLALLDDDPGDLAGDVGRDQHLLRADIGVVGGHVAAAVQIERDAADDGDDRQHHQQQGAAIALEAALLRRGGRVPARWRAAFWSGASFRAGSAIVLFLSLFLAEALEGVTDVFLDVFELGHQPLGIGGRNAVHRGCGDFRLEAGQLGRAAALQRFSDRGG